MMLSTRIDGKYLQSAEQVNIEPPEATPGDQQQQLKWMGMDRMTNSLPERRRCTLFQAGQRDCCHRDGGWRQRWVTRRFEQLTRNFWAKCNWFSMPNVIGWQRFGVGAIIRDTTPVTALEFSGDWVNTKLFCLLFIIIYSLRTKHSYI